MNEQTAAAEEHLKVIRSLMEKATIYRAVSAPVALAGSIASILCGVSLFCWSVSNAVLSVEFRLWFLLGWMIVLAITLAASTFFIWKDARMAQERFFSAGMRKALLAMLPPILCGAFLTCHLMLLHSPVDLTILSILWMICYGLALLATASFAPRSIIRLGWMFLSAGLGSLVVVLYWMPLVGLALGIDEAPVAANLLMTLTFGGFHLLYAFCTWPRKQPENSAGQPHV